MGLLNDVKKEAAEKRGDRNRLKEYTTEFRYVLQGLELLLISASLAVTSVYALWSAHYNQMPQWGAVALTVAGAFSILIAFMQFIKLLNRRG